mmetsp:Transcript_19423/g.33386  ORF Transcript_19423/g.33386 Transcript_19423/m.33386 type:complete len:264 (+) Transcript_19423:107-898(+)
MSCGSGVGDIEDVVGRVHSIESLSCTDGPGNRFMVFLQGCNLRCVYCQNPDTWETEDKDPEKRKRVDEVLAKIKSCVPYLKPHNGGITVSGGEPMLQGKFLSELFKKVKELGITTCVDTAGITPKENWDMVLPYTDFVLYCPKAFTPQGYHKITKTPKSNFTLSQEFANQVAQRNIKMWLRFVLVPGYTDNEEEIDKLIEFCTAHKHHLAQVELLPYHTLGVSKYQELGITYPLKDVEPPSKELTGHVVARLKEAGIDVLLSQ